jgi:hypothetical protein
MHLNFYSITAMYEDLNISLHFGGDSNSGSSVLEADAMAII